MSKFMDWWTGADLLEQAELETRANEETLEIIFNAIKNDYVSTKSYTIPAVYRCQQLLADTVASLSLNAVSEETGRKIGRPVLLRDPVPTQTYHDAMASIVYSLLMDGNAYLLPRTRTNSGEVTSLLVANPQEVNVDWDNKQIFREYSWRNQTMEPDMEIVHIAMNQFPGNAKGLSPLTAARLMLDGVKAEANFAKKLFEDDATVSVVIKTMQNLTKDEASALASQFSEAHAGRKKPAVMSGGADLIPITINPVDAQFLETRNFSIQEIARLFGVPAYFLGVDQGSSLTYSTTESLYRLFLTSTLAPTFLEPIEQAFTRMLPFGVRARFDTSELLRADQKSRYDSNAIALQAGFLTVNEVRASEGLPPVDGGDVFVKNSDPEEGGDSKES